MSQDEAVKEVQKEEEPVEEDVDVDVDGGGGLDEEDEEEVLTLKSSDNKTFQVKRIAAKLSTLIETVLKGDAKAKEIEVHKVKSDILELIVEYLEHHKGVEPKDLQCPVRSTDMKQICEDEWDAEFIDKKDKKMVFEIILAANYMDIKSLLHLGCAKIATEIKKLDQKEIHKIIEEEEKYRKEHAQENEEKEENKEES